MANVSAVSIAAVGVIFTGLIASILSLAVDKWGQFEIERLGQRVKTYYGLINVCVCGEDADCVCIKFVDRKEEVADYLRACLAAVCLAFIANLVTLFTMIMWILNLGSNSLVKILKVATVVLLAVAVFWNVIAVIVFGAMDKKEEEKDLKELGIPLENYKLGWAWGMAILAAILELAGLAVAGMSQKSD